MPHRRARLAALLLVLGALAGCASLQGPPPTAPSPGASALRLEPFLDGFTDPLLVVDDPATRGGLHVVEQSGLVWRVVEGKRDDAPWLDVRGLVRAGGEQGLLGLAFDPDGERFYLSYTDKAGDSVLERRWRGEPARVETLLRVEQPYGNHNGGHVLFGPDGHLYYGLGDGGAAGDPHGNGQDPHALLGSLLRLDVRPERGYAIPPDNPYADGARGAPEVWAKGLRNPWRFSFDRATGDLYIADVGQNRLEEVDVLPAGAPGGANFGWNVYEGDRRYGLAGGEVDAHVAPVATYTHDDGCSVTGGFVYRGEDAPALRGVYLLGDYCSGIVWGLRRDGDAWEMQKLLATDLRISSFGEDEDGELYVVHHGGSILRVAAGAAPFG